MEFELVKWGAYVLSGIVGAFVNILWRAQEKMRDDFSLLEKGLPVVYLRRDEFKEVIREVKESMQDAVHPVLTKLDKLEERIQEQARENDRIFTRREHDRK